MAQAAAAPDLGASLRDIVSDTDLEFRKRHPEWKDKTLVGGTKLESERKEWKDIFVRRAMDIVAIHRDMIEAGKIGAGA